MDKERLTKLMMMTTSSNDAEVVVAVRKANQLLAQAGMTWEEFIRLRPVAPRTSSPPPRTPSPAWEAPSVQREFAEFTSGWTYNEKKRTAEVPPGISEDEVDRLMELAVARVRGSTSFGRVVRGIKSWWDRERKLTPKQLTTIKRAASM